MEFENTPIPEGLYAIADVFDELAGKLRRSLS
jgi:hypothetical protein